MNQFSQHHDFFGTQPTPAEPAPEVDPNATVKAYNRGVIANTFASPEAQVALALIRKLAAHLPDEPINYPAADKTHQMLVWRAARVALMDEIQAIIDQENKR